MGSFPGEIGNLACQPAIDFLLGKSSPFLVEALILLYLLVKHSTGELTERTAFVNGISNESLQQRLFVGSKHIDVSACFIACSHIGKAD